MSAPARTCPTGKRRYDSANEARRAMTSIRTARARSENGRARRETSAYRCPICLGFHLTSRRNHDQTDRRHR